MKRILTLVLFSAAASVPAATAPATETSRLPDEIRRLLPPVGDETGFHPLFGAQADDGWAQCGPGSFTLTNGIATSHAGMGLWWHTNRMFTNFILRGEGCTLSIRDQ